MKKVLIVIMDMGIGGAQKSLLSFLQCLTPSSMGEAYDIHLMVIKPGGALMSQLPAQVKMVQPPKELRWLGMPLSRKLVSKYFSWRSVWGETCWLLRSRLKLFQCSLNKQQCLWECWKKLIAAHEEHYDVAISYIDGFTNYYVMDKVNADRKILWVHNEYQKQECDAEYDRPYYEVCDGIVTISEKCQQCIVQEFPQCADKTYVLENITTCKSVISQSEVGSCEEYEKVTKLKLLSVGRLNHLKGFDMAIGAARRLRDAGVQFLWLVIGEGPEHQHLQEMIDEHELSDCFQLIGARDNPYGYMKECDIIVQPSRSEGKSIVLDEAKILCKPIVATNYTTVYDSIEHGKSGWIVDMTEEAVFDGVLRVYQDPVLRKSLCECLQNLPKGNEKELTRYVKVMLEA